MEKRISENNKKYYLCRECGLKYKNRILAEKCEKWCKKHKSCNLEITKNAIII